MLRAVGMAFLVIGLAMTACSGEADDESADSGGVVQNNNTDAAADARAATDLSAYLRDNFGLPGAATTWYAFITGVDVEKGMASIQTTVLADGEGRAAVAPICSALLGYINDRTQVVVERARILGQDGHTVTSC